ncbi:RidA family protein [Achromobacter spanius]|uniref:Endoribonuclease L-PSP n=1 Tax=Achromobacter spanius TaxID=217203 RepID=A0AAW3I370_9BURK|nr:RidA family protein [Achromobacter spanius]KNE27161.1 endoribonuclease L-PSP [Achromobacter spanius]
MNNDIVRKDTNQRLSRIVIHGDTVYVAGVTSTAEGGIVPQTRDVLAKIDGYLAQAGTDKSRLLSVQIWLKDIDRDFAGMNSVWAEWALPDAMPTRATCEAKLAAPELLVEIIVTAAKRSGFVSGPVSES